MPSIAAASSRSISIVENLDEKASMPKKERAKKRRGKGMRGLTKMLSPNAAQQKLIDELKIQKQANKDARRESHNSKKEHLLAMLHGDVTLKSAKKTIRVEHNEQVEAKHDQIDIWIELIDSLDDDQRQQLSKSFNARKGKPKRRWSRFWS